MGTYLCPLFSLLLLLLSCNPRDNGAQQQQVEKFDLEILLDRSDVIWGMEFLPDQRIIFSERKGNILIYHPETKEVINLHNVPPVAPGGEGGLLDLRLHPDFKNNAIVYFCYTEESGGGRTQALGRAVLRERTLENRERIFSAGSPNRAPNHFGCRIEFSNSHLYLSLGDQAEGERAQNPLVFQGKILRMNFDGTMVEIFSAGHRNPQGLTTNPATGELFSSEHGPSGGDELNIIQEGKNYGWPFVTLGEPPGALGRSSPGLVDPIASWTPSIAPSGIIFHRGNLYMATLRGEHIRRLVLRDHEVVEEEMLFPNEGLRFRTLRNGPDGYLYFSTDDGKIGRIKEAQ